PSAAFKVYYSGWDASGEIPASGAGIHHPRADEKRINVFDQPARRARLCPDEQCAEPTAYVWRVIWSQGINEPGSSGSGLWNQDKRLVGVLYGGLSECGAYAPEAPDYYGRLDIAWPAGFKQHLDPKNRGVL